LKNRWIGLIIILIIGVCLYGCKDYEKSVNETVPEYVFTYAENQPANYPTSKAASKFAQLVKERSEGRIHIQVIYDAEFGTQQQTVNQMKFGGVDFARVSLSSLSDELPILNVLQLPFLYEDSSHMWRVLNGEIGQELWNTFYELDLVPLSWFDAGARSFYSVDPINSIEDIEGMNIRVQESQLMRDMITLLGGNPIDRAYAEVYSAFETGEIDAAENSWSSYHASAHYKVARYYIVDEHTRVPEIQLIAGETWRLLSDEDREIMLSAAKDAAEYEKELWKEHESIARSTALKYGAQEILLSEQELERFREKMIPLYEEYCSEYMDIIEKIEQVR
jgi:tripartite ATP-independent transporter DctP family solute receptor